MEVSLSPLVGGDVSPADRRNRFLLFILWLVLVGWFLWGHTFWRDEVRAFSFALSGANTAEMLRITHGEGHPALWYLLLRGAHNLFPFREVLPALGALIGIAAMAVLAFFAPFRTAVIGLMLFSLYGAFEYVVVSRNYGIAALLMFTLAALYPRIRNSLWLGGMIALLCNTNVPSAVLAACFLLFRLVEMLTNGSRPGKREWLVFAGNSILALAGALLVFKMVYPTFNDAALSPHYGLSVGRVLGGLVDLKSGFTDVGVGLGMIVLPLACVGLISRPAPFIAALAGLIGMKEFFYLIYPSNYRHDVLYLCFLIALYWMASRGAGGTWREKHWMKPAARIGVLVFLALLVLQTGKLFLPIKLELEGTPYSRSRDVGRLLHQPALKEAIVMADPDTMLEPLPYYADNPLYFLRRQHFGKVAQFSNNARQLLTLDDILGDAKRLHLKTGRPVVFLSHLELSPTTNVRRTMMYNDETLVTPEAARRFLLATRMIARLRPSGTDENYDVYVYPR